MDDDVPPYEALNPNRGEVIEGLLACSLATDILIREANDEGAVSLSKYLIPICLFCKMTRRSHSPQMPRIRSPCSSKPFTR